MIATWNSKSLVKFGSINETQLNKQTNKRIKIKLTFECRVFVVVVVVGEEETKFYEFNKRNKKMRRWT